MTDAPERLIRKLRTKEPYKHALQIFAETSVVDAMQAEWRPKIIGDYRVLLGHRDCPTLHQLADEARHVQDQAADLIEAQAARIAEFEGILLFIAEHQWQEPEPHWSDIPDSIAKWVQEIDHATITFQSISKDVLRSQTPTSGDAS